MLQAGSLDDVNAVAPTAAIYVRDAARWDKIDPALKTFDRMPSD
jgi:hypothetical protein